MHWAGHSTHFQVGSEGVLQNQYAKQSRTLLSLWHFHFWKQSSRGKMQLDGQFTHCPAAVKCPNWYSKLLYACPSQERPTII